MAMIDQLQEQLDYINRFFALKTEAGTVDFDKLNVTLSGFAGLFAWICWQSTIATSDFARKENEYDIWFAKLVSEEFPIAKAEKASTTNESMRARIIAKHTEAYISYKQDLIDLQQKADFFKSMKNMLDKEASVLQTLSANIREEMKLAENRN